LLSKCQHLFILPFTKVVSTPFSIIPDRLNRYKTRGSAMVNPINVFGIDIVLNQFCWMTKVRLATIKVRNW